MKLLLESAPNHVQHAYKELKRAGRSYVIAVIVGFIFLMFAVALFTRDPMTSVLLSSCMALAIILMMMRAWQYYHHATGLLVQCFAARNAATTQTPKP